MEEWRWQEGEKKGETDRCEGFTHYEAGHKTQTNKHK